MGFCLCDGVGKLDDNNKLADINGKVEDIATNNKCCNRLWIHYPRCGTFLNLLTCTLLTSLLVCSMYLWRDYVHDLLLWTEHQPDYVVILIFLGLFTIVSLPFAWGYIIINIACGYIFGVVHGTLVTLFTATAGTLIAHFIIKSCMVSYVRWWLSSSDSMKSLYLVLSGKQSFRLVALSRFTPVPFGLQNAVFAVSNLSTGRYLAASAIGCLPSQLLNAYLGSTLRSMEEVMDGEETKTTGYLLLVSQVVMMVVVAVFVVRRAKLELARTMTLLEEGGEDVEKGGGGVEKI